MNKKRRKRLEQALEYAGLAQSEVELCKDEEQEAYDSLPESLQFSERGDAMQDCVSSLECAENSLMDAIESIQEALS